MKHLNTLLHHPDAGRLLLRLSLATVFLFHGAQKLFGLFGGYGIAGTAQFMESIGLPFPSLSATLAGGAEFFGGLAFLTGVGLRVLGVPLTITMLVAAFSLRQSFDVQAGGMEYPLTLALASAALVLMGPGSFRLRLGSAANSASDSRRPSHA